MICVFVMVMLRSPVEKFLGYAIDIPGYSTFFNGYIIFAVLTILSVDFFICWKFQKG